MKSNVYRAIVSMFFGLAAVAFMTAAHGQSATALAGIAAYNRGDIPAAYRLLRAAADVNDPEGQVNLGYMYARGQGVAENQAEAFRLYSLSARQGDGEGMNALGYKYLFGTGVAPDSQKAVSWFCAAIAQGNPRAMNNLAGMLASGDYLTRDDAEARSLWMQAAARGHANAMFNLARSYTLGPDPDLAKAQQWIVKAGERGHPEAIQYLRSSGYTGALPAPFDEVAMIIPFVKGKAGHTKVCSLIS